MAGTIVGYCCLHRKLLSVWRIRERGCVDAVKQNGKGKCRHLLWVREGMDVGEVQKITEADIQRQIRDYLRWTGWFVYKNHQSLGSYRGVADLTAIKDGRVVWIEVKKPGGRQSREQEKFQREIEAHGGVYIVARSVEDVEEAIERIFGGQKCLA